MITTTLLERDLEDTVIGRKILTNVEDRINECLEGDDLTSVINHNIDNKINNIINIIFPVGSIYTTTQNIISPNDILGTNFEWQLLEDGIKLESGSSNYGSRQLLEDGIKLESGSSNYGSISGSNFITLNTNNIPSHNHTFSGTTNTTGNHNHKMNIYDNNSENPAYGAQADSWAYRGRLMVTNWNGNSWYTESNGNHNHTFSGTTSSIGSSQPFDISGKKIIVKMFLRIR